MANHMLRLRHQDGRTSEVPEGVFVEIVDPGTQKLGAALFSPRPGEVLHITPGSRDARRYTTMFPGAQFADAVIPRT